MLYPSAIIPSMKKKYTDYLTFFNQYYFNEKKKIHGIFNVLQPTSRQKDAWNMLHPSAIIASMKNEMHGICYILRPLFLPLKMRCVEYVTSFSHYRFN
jgi:hypothetical protein